MKPENNVAAQAGDEPMREALNKLVRYRSANSGMVPHSHGSFVHFDDVVSALSQVSPRAKADVERDSAKLKAAIIAALKAHTQEMEGYSYFGSNPGVPKDDYKEIADEILATTKPGA